MNYLFNQPTKQKRTIMKKETQELTLVQPELQEVLNTTHSVELTKAQSHASKFAPSMVKYHEIASKLKDLDKANPTPEMAKIARRARLDLVPIRTEAANIKDELKSTLLIEGNLIQSLFNVVKQTCELTESEFAEIEKHQEKLEAEAKVKLKLDREAKLLPFEVDTQFIAIADMSEEQFDALLANSKLAFETKAEQAKQAELARIEAERLAEEKRLTELKVEQQRLEAQRLENERLKAEADKREKEMAAERERLTKEQAEKDRLAKIESDKQAKILADAKAEADKLAKQIKDKEDAEKLAQEQEKARIEAEEADKLAKEKALLLAPDKEKVKVFFEKFKSLEFPELESEAGRAMSIRVNEALQVVRALIIEDSKTLL